jgi:hypothetical protein
LSFISFSNTLFGKSLIIRLLASFTIQDIKKKLRGPSPRANYTDRETAAC